VPSGQYHQNPKPGGGRKRRRMLELPESKRQDYARVILTTVRTGKTGK
jgi:hypothetical protein